MLTRTEKERALRTTILKRFEEPDEVRTFEKGKFEFASGKWPSAAPRTYRDGSGRFMSGPPWARRAAMSSMEGWCFLAVLPLQWTTARSTNFARARSFTFHPGTIVGSSAMCHMSRYIFSG